MPTTDTATKVTCPFCGEPTACAECGHCFCAAAPPRDPYCTLDGFSPYDWYLATYVPCEWDDEDEDGSY